MMATRMPAAIRKIRVGTKYGFSFAISVCNICGSFKAGSRAEFCTPGPTHSILKFLRKAFTFNELLTQHESPQLPASGEEVIPLTQASKPLQRFNLSCNCAA